MLRIILLAIGFSILSTSCSNKITNQDTQASGLYTEDWESLGPYNEEPEWFQDAKFGIYFHWGVYSVPAYGNEWYPRMMHVEGLGTYEHHLEKYGHPSEFGYHDFVPMFKAEQFDPEDWADLFQKAGAKFAGPVAEHHDGFAMWDSETTPWNSMDKGPGRDVTGELEQAIRERDMKFITTFHHARNLQRYKGLEEEVITRELNIYNQFRKSHYPLYPGMPPTLDDPELNYLYGNIPEAEWLEEIWYGKLVEVVDRYRPDIIYFDSWLNHIPESMRLKFCAYYLNRAAEWDKEVVIVRKQHDLPLEYSVDDLEKTRKNHLAEKTWMTDETISNGSWCYTEDLKIKSSRDHLHVLIDIVSKNGILLLNISPMADGTIPMDQRKVLLEMGEWLKIYGEAIYNTRPWYTFGEGPTKEPEGKHPGSAFNELKYSSEDIRYTRSGNTVYAIFLGSPPADENVLLTAFSRESAGRRIRVGKITIPGSNAVLECDQTRAGLSVHIPEQGLNDLATVLKIEIQ